MDSPTFDVQPTTAEDDAVEAAVDAITESCTHGRRNRIDLLREGACPACAVPLVRPCAMCGGDDHGRCPCCLTGWSIGAGTIGLHICYAIPDIPGT